MANVGNQLPTQAVSKPPSGKHGNVLPLWGNEKTMNLNPMILTNVLSSPYFKVQLYELKTYHEVVDEIYFKVTHIEPWEKGSRKTAGQTGMCGGVRGVGTGGIVSTAFCLLYKLFTLKLTRKQVMGLITHTDSPYIRALGFMYIRYTQPPTDLLDWYNDFLDDEEMPIVQQVNWKLYLSTVGLRECKAAVLYHIKFISTHLESSKPPLL
uniref:Pre-mRNA-splicing factor 38B n=1 Tax=Cyprinodon variegatus TaxID=28743 RepID=A0A3Q2CGN0_CYPVA